MTTNSEHVRVLSDFASAYDADSVNGQALRAAIAALQAQAQGDTDWALKRDAMIQMLLAASEDIDEMAKRTGPSRFPSVSQLNGWRRMVDSIIAALPIAPPAASVPKGPSHD